MNSEDVSAEWKVKWLFPLEFEGVLIEVGYRIEMRVDQLILVEN